MAEHEKLKSDCLEFRLASLRLSKENKKLKEENRFLHESHRNMERAWLTEVQKNADLTMRLEIYRLEVNPTEPEIVHER